MATNSYSGLAQREAQRRAQQEAAQAPANPNGPPTFIPQAPVKTPEDLLRERQTNANAGGYNSTDRDITRQERFNAGLAQGRRIFSDDPVIQDLERRRQDLSKGYDGQELGAMRGLARSEMDGQRQKAIQTIRSNLAKGGVGGARGAAIQGAAQNKLQQTSDDTERKMLLDQSQMKRTGVNDLQDFLFRKKYGESAFGVANQQLGAADDALLAGQNANQGGGAGGIQGIFENFTPAGWAGLYDDQDWGI